jgi:antibiotic biosynthesis monooxygenase (ABM) superfamily enzyme
MKRLMLALLLGLSCSALSTMAADVAPNSVIHVVTVSWKSGAKPEQIQAALDGVKALPAAYPGITRVWTKTMKAQGERTAAIVMEFKDDKAFKDYTGSAAQKEWYKVYQPVRDESTTFDITN